MSTLRNAKVGQTVTVKDVYKRQLDHKLHIDDPVGAVAVHMMNGIWGTVAVGLFATTSVPGNDTFSGLFYLSLIHIYRFMFERLAEFSCFVTLIGSIH